MSDSGDEKERLVRVETKIDTILMTLVTKVDNIQTKQNIMEADFREVKKDVDSSKKRLDDKESESNKLKWLVYSIIIAAILGLIII